MGLDNRKNRIPILIGKRISRRIVRRRIEDDEQRILLFEKFRRLRRKSIRIEGKGFIKKLERRQTAPDILAKRIVRPPEPIGSEYGVADLGVVLNRMVHGARATRRRNSLDVACRAMAAENDVLHAVEIRGQTRDRRIGDDLRNRQLAQHLLDRRQAGEFLVLAENRAQRSVRDLLRSMLLRRCRRCAARSKDHVVQNFVFRMRCCHLRTHFMMKPPNCSGPCLCNGNPASQSRGKNSS